MRRVLSGVLLFTLSGAAGAAPDPLVFDDKPQLREIIHPEWFKTSFLDLGDDLEQALQSGKNGIMVYFGQENCAYCEALMENDFGDPAIAVYTQRHFDVIDLDIWGARGVVDLDDNSYTEREFAIFNETNFTPSILFLVKGGMVALRLRGYYPPYRFRAALEYVADNHYTNASFSEYLERADPPPRFDEDDLNQREFFLPPPHNLNRSQVPAQRPLIVFFEQPKCHACDVMHSEALMDDHVLQQLQGFDLVQLNLAADTPVITPLGVRTTVRNWGRRLGIIFTPSLLFFDRHGAQVFRVDSVAKVYRLGRILDYVLEDGYRTGLNYQQWHGRREPQN